MKQCLWHPQLNDANRLWIFYLTALQEVSMAVNTTVLMRGVYKKPECLEEAKN